MDVLVGLQSATSFYATSSKLAMSNSTPPRSTVKRDIVNWIATGTVKTTSSVELHYRGATI